MALEVEHDIKMISTISPQHEAPASPSRRPQASLAENLARGPSTTLQSGGRERRNPSVTPRKFRRFFTPRGQPELPLSSSRQALHDITAQPSLNQDAAQSSSPTDPFRSVKGQENSDFPRDLKRRKVGQSDLSSVHNSPGPKERGFMPLQEKKPAEDNWEHVQSSPCERALLMVDDSDNEEMMQAPPKPRGPVKRIVPARNRGLGAQLLGRSVEGLFGPGRQHHVYPVNDYQDETASFYTRPSDVHSSMSMTRPGRCIPFCVTGLNTNSLVAIGDEEGSVKFVESAKAGTPAFDDAHLAIRPHINAIIDIVFSEDDLQLGTASGDQTARVVDMTTQTCTAIFAHHSASLKQIRFQPGNDSILATSSRDGTIQIWDRRCKGADGPAHFMHHAIENNVRVEQASTKITYGRPVNSMYDAHRTWNAARISPNRIDASPREGPGETRAGSVSVTALQFLPVGQEHLLLSACEADASVRLWDIRLLYNKSKGSPTPISITKPPPLHSSWRHFGNNSINLSGDGSRIYTLCKDNTVYAYSTAHLIAGHAPELARTTQTRAGPQRGVQEGLAPLYGFRHPKMHATTFYVKSAIRKAKDGKPELLAVGSSDHCALLFPTDERYLKFPDSTSTPQSDGTLFGPSLPLLRRPTLRRSGSGIGLGGRGENPIPICTNGTALVRGHDAEVNALCWSNDGELITVGDDFNIRCWREGSDARELRQGGETQGRRWNCGWAEVSESYDEDDD